MGTNKQLPDKIVAHGHWTVDGVKVSHLHSFSYAFSFFLSLLIFLAQMSKSLGNMVDPFAEIAKFGAEELRFFLLAESRLDGDGGVYFFFFLKKKAFL